MIIQIAEIIGGTIAVIVVAALLAIIIFFKFLVVVPFNEVHVVSRGNVVNTHDGHGRYLFVPFLHGRTIIPKHVLDIEPNLIKLHDKDNLPFGVEISIKVQVIDPQKAAATLTSIDHNTVKKVVEDTVMSAARSIAMERNILDIMKKREEIEDAIYQMVADALLKLGLAAIIFDIKNIRDIEGADVIEQLEKVKIAELRKDARISEAIHNNKAIEIEVETLKKSNVKREQMLKEEEDAKLLREQEITAKQRKVEEEKLKIEEQKSNRMAEIAKNKEKILAEAAREKKMIEAQSEADAIAIRAKSEAEAISIRAKSEAEAIKIKAEAEAQTIREKGFAEADIIRKKAEAMNVSELAGQLKLLEVLGRTQIDSAEAIASALGNNNKIMYMPMNGDKGILDGLLPKIDSLLQSGLLDEFLSKFSGLRKNKKNPEEEIEIIQ